MERNNTLLHIIEWERKQETIIKINQRYNFYENLLIIKKGGGYEIHFSIKEIEKQAWIGLGFYSDAYVDREIYDYQKKWESYQSAWEYPIEYTEMDIGVINHDHPNI